MTGTGYQSRAVDGPWGSLSIVNGADSGEYVTKADVPARDFDGHPVSGGVKIAGAVTVGLNRDQADRADQNRLWLQGGTPTDPMLYSDPEFTGRYGFGALRCAIDDLNGDNVETVQFPSGTRHMYCYAYYVTPPPSSGTIVIRKEVTGSEASESFRFGGNVSYNDGGVFDLSAAEGDPASTEFLRAETRAGRRAVDGHRGRSRGLDADRPGVRVAVEHDDGRRRDAHRADQPGGGRHRHVHLHEPAHAAGRRARGAQGHPERHRDVPVPHPRRGRRRRRAPQPHDALARAGWEASARSSSIPAATGSPSAGPRPGTACGGCPASSATANAGL